MDETERIVDRDPMLGRTMELEALEPDYEYAREFVQTSAWKRDKARIRARIERTIMSYGGSLTSEFVLGQCHALVKELNRFDDIIRTYESKKKSLDEYRRIKPARK